MERSHATLKAKWAEEAASGASGVEKSAGEKNVEDVIEQLGRQTI